MIPLQKFVSQIQRQKKKKNRIIQSVHKKADNSQNGFFLSFWWVKIQNSVNSMLQFEVFFLFKHMCLWRAYILSEYGL